MRLIATQFGHPRGGLGQLIGHVLLARGNASINRWMVQLLDVQPSDHLLEIGCGPGVAIEGFAALAKEGRVVGIDASTVMVEQARKRNAKAIAGGRVEIEQAEASRLPYPDASFEKVVATHVIYFWLDVGATLQEVRRVLRPGGVVAIGFQIRQHMPPVAQQGFAQTSATLYAQPEEVEAVLAASGFTRIRVEMHQTERGPAGFCALGHKEGGES